MDIFEVYGPINMKQEDEHKIPHPKKSKGGTAEAF